MTLQNVNIFLVYKINNLFCTKQNAQINFSFNY